MFLSASISGPVANVSDAGDHLVTISGRPLVEFRRAHAAFRPTGTGMESPQAFCRKRSTVADASYRLSKIRQVVCDTRRKHVEAYEAVSEMLDGWEIEDLVPVPPTNALPSQNQMTTSKISSPVSTGSCEVTEPNAGGTAGSGSRVDNGLRTQNISVPQSVPTTINTGAGLNAAAGSVHGEEPTTPKMRAGQRQPAAVSPAKCLTLAQLSLIELNKQKALAAKQKKLRQNCRQMLHRVRPQRRQISRSLKVCSGSDEYSCGEPNAIRTKAFASCSYHH